jgi:hypothetical protein
MERAASKLAIHVPESEVGYEILWVSPLAYPNLFGNTGFFVVVVVVVVVYTKMMISSKKVQFFA